MYLSALSLHGLVFILAIFVPITSFHQYQEIMEDQWEYHKDVMEQSFRSGKTLEEVMNFMKQTYNFYARYQLVLRCLRWYL